LRFILEIIWTILIFWCGFRAGEQTQKIEKEHYKQVINEDKEK